MKFKKNHTSISMNLLLLKLKKQIKTMKIKTFEQLNENIEFENIIFLLQSDDWQGLYIDNNLIMEGDAIANYEFIEKFIELGIDFKNKKFDSTYIEDKSEEFFNLSRGRCPKTLQEVYDNIEKLGI